MPRTVQTPKGAKSPELHVARPSQVSDASLSTWGTEHSPQMLVGRKRMVRGQEKGQRVEVERARTIIAIKCAARPACPSPHLDKTEKSAPPHHPVHCAWPPHVWGCHTDRRTHKIITSSPVSASLPNLLTRRHSQEPTQRGFL